MSRKKGTSGTARVRSVWPAGSGPALLGSPAGWGIPEVSLSRSCSVTNLYVRTLPHVWTSLRRLGTALPQTSSPLAASRTARRKKEADPRLAQEALSKQQWTCALTPCCVSCPHRSPSGPGSRSAGSQSSSREASDAAGPGDTADLAEPDSRLRAGTPVPLGTLTHISDLSPCL